MKERNAKGPVEQSHPRRRNMEKIACLYAIQTMRVSGQKCDTEMSNDENTYINTELEDRYYTL